MHHYLMAQVSKRRVDKKIYSQLQDSLSYVIKDLKSKREAEEFLNSFFTETEKLMFAKRVLAAFLLSNNVEEKQISDILKLTPSTISRLKMQLALHPEGYKYIFKKLNKKSNEDLAKQLFYQFLNYAIKAASGITPTPRIK